MDNYVIIKMIGEGAFGKIFLARKKEDNQQCVIKEINLSKVIFIFYNSSPYSMYTFDPW